MGKDLRSFFSAKPKPKSDAIAPTATNSKKSSPPSTTSKTKSPRAPKKAGNTKHTKKAQPENEEQVIAPTRSPIVAATEDDDFVKVRRKKKRSNVVVDSDDDEEVQNNTEVEEAPEQRLDENEDEKSNSEARKPSRKKKVLQDDDDEEELEAPSVKTPPPRPKPQRIAIDRDSFFAQAMSAGDEKKKKKKKIRARKATASLVDTNTSRFFGGGAIETKPPRATAKKNDTLEKGITEATDDDASMALALHLEEREKMKSWQARRKEEEAKKRTEAEDASLALAMELEQKARKTPKETEKQPGKTTPKKAAKKPAKKRTKKTPKHPVVMEKTEAKKKPKLAPTKPENTKAAIVENHEGTGMGGAAIFKETTNEAPPLKKKMSFWQAQNRGPPPMAGQKPMPEGKNLCLTGLTFVLTGLLESLERDDCKDLIMKFGGRVTGSVSGRTNYLVAGSEPGESKIEKANAKGTKIIDEDALFDIIRNAPEGGIPPKGKKRKKPSSNKTPTKAPRPAIPPPTSSTTNTTKHMVSSHNGTQRPRLSANNCSTSHQGSSQLWVDKFKPQRLADLVGNQTHVGRIQQFLRNWHTKFGPGGSKKGKRALLISGAPGTGKTTAAALIGRLEGYEVQELNASDTRSKKSIEAIVYDLVGNHSMSEYFASTSGNGRASKKKTLLIMDEVDGMSGADRGGLPALVKVIAKSKAPIICICNDGGNRKLKTLKSYSEAYSWRRPTGLQIVPRIIGICRSEGLTIDKPAVEKLVEATNGDLRQILNILQMWNKTQRSVSFDQVKKQMATAGKDFDLGPFDVANKFFARVSPTDTNWVNKRINHYFVDADLLPLFVQENYPKCAVHLVCPDNPGKGDRADVMQMEAMAEAADSISHGDLMTDLIYRGSNYSLMPMHAMFSAVAPGAIVAGRSAFTSFPSWLGKNSTTGKNNRLASQTKLVMSVDVKCNQADFTMFYLPFLREMLARPLLEHGMAGVEEVAALLTEYSLTRDDWGSIMELGAAINMLNVDGIDGKVKATLTRRLTAAHSQLKVARSSGKKFVVKADKMPVEENDDSLLEEEPSQANDDDDMSNDKMIKQKKPKKPRATQAKRKKPTAKKPRKKKK